MNLYIKNGIIKSRTLIVIDTENSLIYNPTEETLFKNGWEVYTPPTPSQPEITSEQMYKYRVIELVREEYSIDDELAILRQRDSKIDEFNTYNTFVEECKVIARREIYGELI